MESAPDLLLRDLALREGAAVLLRDAQALALRLIQDHRAAVLSVAAAILERDHLSGQDVEELVAKQARDGANG